MTCHLVPRLANLHRTNPVLLKNVIPRIKLFQQKKRKRKGIIIFFFCYFDTLKKLKLELPSIIHSEYECKIQNVMAIFPNRSSLEIKQCLSITNGDVNDAIQLMLVESENEPPFSLNGQKQCQAVHPQVTLYQEFNDIFRFYLLHAWSCVQMVYLRYGYDWYPVAWLG